GLATTIKLLGSVNARKMAFAADTVVLPNWREQLRIPRFAVERRIPHWISSGSKLRRVRANSTGSSETCCFTRLALIILLSKNMNSLEVLLPRTRCLCAFWNRCQPAPHRNLDSLCAGQERRGLFRGLLRTSFPTPTLLFP